MWELTLVTSLQLLVRGPPESVGSHSFPPFPAPTIVAPLSAAHPAVEPCDQSGGASALAGHADSTRVDSPGADPGCRGAVQVCGFDSISF